MIQPDTVRDLLELGTRVTFSHVLRRRAESLPDRRATGGYQDRKVWRPVPALPQTGRLATPGIVIGLRTLANGVVRYGGYEEPTTFTPDGDRIPAILISYDLRRKPVLVLPEHVDLANVGTLL